MSGSSMGHAVRALAEEEFPAATARKKSPTKPRVKPEDVPVEEPPSPSIVAVIPMHGPVVPPYAAKNGVSIISIDTHLDAIAIAFAIEGVRAVVLDIDSGGGSPAEAYLVSQEILRQKQKSNIPVYAFIRGTAASAAYWLSCAADKIYALPVSDIGSIGVIRSDDGFGYPKKLKKSGIERRLITSGHRKVMLDPYASLKKSELRLVKEKMRELHEIFFQAVTDSRGDRLNAPDKKLMTGESWLASKAMKQGLIDGIGDMRGIIPQLVDGPVQYTSLQDIIGNTLGGEESQEDAGPEEDVRSDQAFAARLRYFIPFRM